MGNSIKKFKLRRLTNDSSLGKDTAWPIWNDVFHKDTTYGVFNSHIDMCQNRGSINPAMQK